MNLLAPSLGSGSLFQPILGELRRKLGSLREAAPAIGPSPITITDCPEKYIVSVDVRDLKEADIDVRLVGKELTIKLRSSKPKRDSSENAASVRQHIVFLCAAAARDTLEWHVEDGFLNVLVPKNPLILPRRIPMH
jgi:HSP20 family molecular chaperone IbpA